MTFVVTKVDIKSVKEKEYSARKEKNPLKKNNNIV